MGPSHERVCFGPFYLKSARIGVILRMDGLYPTCRLDIGRVLSYDKASLWIQTQPLPL